MIRDGGLLFWGWGVPCVRDMYFLLRVFSRFLFKMHRNVTAFFEPFHARTHTHTHTPCTVSGTLFAVYMAAGSPSNNYWSTGVPRGRVVLVDASSDCVSE